jgi:serine/threonine-protein kinase
MPLSTGSRLGPYEILSAIGAGGMGEVYRARDTKLGRDVAIKVLPEVFARDAERMARFQREAKVLASLNHPNIATIHGLEDSGGTHALVMELVEGRTLADRIKAGPVPVDEAIRMARQIADALEYAHERGIIHRDLKPANVKVTNDDAVKVLDFGLAKALEGDMSSIDISTSPTISRMATQQGVLLGTAAYMSPEQAKAKSVDRRADIWAFGCVLYEMLTGKVAYPGESVTDTLATVIRAEPDWSVLSASTPMRVRVLLQRCLQKDPKQRLRDIGDARISLDEVLSGVSLEPPSPGTPVVAHVNWWQIGVWSSIALLIGAALAGLAAWNLKPSPTRPVTRLTLALPPGQSLIVRAAPAIAISPDGARIAYVGRQIGGPEQLYLRAMDTSELMTLPGTEGAMSPFFSPDSEWLGFFAGDKLKKISVRGGAAVTICDSPFTLQRSASWAANDTIIFDSLPQTGLFQVSAAGGTAKSLNTLDFTSGEAANLWPATVPNTTTVLFQTGPPAAGIDDARIIVRSLKTGDRRDLTGGASPAYAPTGHLIYAQAGTLMAVPLDLERLALRGTPAPVVENVMESIVNGGTQYGLSSTGTLIYLSGGVPGGQRNLVWVDRKGTEQPIPAPAHAYRTPRISPDGRRVAVGGVDTNIWLYDLSRETLTRLTFQGGTSATPTWSPDGKHVAFSSTVKGDSNVYWQPADGSGGAERLTAFGQNQHNAGSWSPDGQLLAFEEVTATTGYDLWILSLRDRKTQPFLHTQFNEAAPQFSPDGHWLAYVSNESGRYEIYVQPYPGPGGKWQISTGGGTEPRWGRNGEIFYRSGDKMMAAETTLKPSFSVGKPRMLFEDHYVPTLATKANYDVTPDGQRFLMVKESEHEGSSPTQINVVLNWTEELKRLVPTGNK